MNKKGRMLKTKTKLLPGVEVSIRVVFANAHNTLYLVDRSRGRCVLTELLAAPFQPC